MRYELNSDSDVPAAGKEQQSDETRLYVGNISWSHDAVSLRALFEKAGVRLLDVYIPRDRTKSRPHVGYGFLATDGIESAQAALALNGSDDGFGRTLIVRKATPRK